MRLLGAAVLGSLLVSAMSSADIERALALARARDAERQQFHRRYIVDLEDPVVTRLEVTTEFRRLELMAEEHVLRGDWMFTRSLRAAQAAMAPTHGLITLRAQLRFHPLNTFVESPPYAIALGGTANGSLEPVETQITPQFSAPYKTRDRKTLSSLIGAVLEATVPAARIGQSVRALAVTLEGRSVARTTIDFSRLD